MNETDQLMHLFMEGRADFYSTMKNRIGASRIHLPIPMKSKNEASLVALVHWFKSAHLARPHTILKVSITSGIEYIHINKATESLIDWIGPPFDSMFEKHEERLLQISSSVFHKYFENQRSNIAEEYVEKFFAITPPEFMSQYRELNNHFFVWLFESNS